MCALISQLKKIVGLKYLDRDFSFLPLGTWDMTPRVFLVILCLGVASAAVIPNPSLDAELQEQKVTYEKTDRLDGHMGTVQRDLNEIRPCY